MRGFGIRPLSAFAGGSLIDLAGSPVFGPKLLEAARSLVDVDEIFGYRTTQGGKPVPLVSASCLDKQDIRVYGYLQRFFRHDPLMCEAHALPQETGFVHHVNSCDIVAPDYRRICFEQPSFFEKLSFGWRGRAETLVLSFYVRSCTDDAAAARLESLADLALAALNRRVRCTDPADFVEMLEGRIALEFKGLTLRERQVLARSIAGWTAEAIADSLGMRSGTVLTYRQRAYDKYQLRSAAEFLPSLM